MKPKVPNYDEDYNFVKGRVAEAIIEQLFLSSDYEVFRYGMENTIPGIMKMLRGDKSPAAHHISRMPDFVLKSKDEKTFFIEVKFRANGKFSSKDNYFYKDYPYKDCYFILVTKEAIKCITYKELFKGTDIDDDYDKHLHCVEEFGLDKELVDKFVEIVKIFFENVQVTNK